MVVAVGFEPTLNFRSRLIKTVPKPLGHTTIISDNKLATARGIPLKVDNHACHPVVISWYLVVGSNYCICHVKAALYH